MLLSEQERGQGLIEYALILVLIVIVVLIAVQLLGPAVKQLYDNINNAI